MESEEERLLSSPDNPDAQLSSEAILEGQQEPTKEETEVAEEKEKEPTIPTAPPLSDASDVATEDILPQRDDSQKGEQVEEKPQEEQNKTVAASQEKEDPLPDVLPEQQEENILDREEQEQESRSGSQIISTLQVKTAGCKETELPEKSPEEEGRKMDMSDMRLESRSVRSISTEREGKETVEPPPQDSALPPADDQVEHMEPKEDTRSIEEEGKTPVSVSSAEEVQSSEGKSKEKRTGGAMASVSRFLRSKKETEKKDSKISGDEGASASTGEGDDSEGEKKKKGGALGHVSRFIGKAIKKEKDKEELDLTANLNLDTSRRDSEMSYSEEREEIPSDILRSVANMKSEIKKIRESIRHVSKSLGERPRIVTYDMIQESNEMKGRILNLLQKVPENISMLRLLESDDSKAKCKQIWQVIGQELEAMKMLAEAIHSNLSKRRV